MFVGDSRFLFCTSWWGKITFIAKVNKHRIFNKCAGAIRTAYWINNQIIKFYASMRTASVRSCKTRRHAIAGSTARCVCKFWYVGLSKFSVASRGFHCSSNAFELNNSINHGKMRVFNIIYLLPHIVCYTVQNAQIVHSMIVRRYVSL